MIPGKISDYSLIGNSRSAALVSRFGSIDWCCLPEFHSASIFSAILDVERGGYFLIAPEGHYHSEQQYIPETNVVETLFDTTKGKVVLTDAFMASTEEKKTMMLFPDHEIMRIVQCESGNVDMRMEFIPSVYYGKHEVNLYDQQRLGIKFEWKENSFHLVSTLENEVIKVFGNKAIATFTLSAGEMVMFSLSCSSQGPAIIPEIKITGKERMKETVLYWKHWISGCHYKGIYADKVKRSALALKLLTHAPSGAIVAAPTTSLPEEKGGERNWDYRYCWLRDASFTVRALLKLGFEEEAHAYMNWILHATQLTQPELQVVYSIYGEARLKESELNWLRGYHDSRPVRIGNGASHQHQLDVYGEVLDAFYAYSSIVDELDGSSRKFLIGLGEVICKIWDQPDKGIWEVRSLAAHYTHSKVLAWVGLDRLLGLVKKYGWKGVDTGKYERTKASIASMVEASGYNDHLGYYSSELNGKNLDASALVFSLQGYCGAHSPRMESTVDQVCQQLAHQHLIYRYRKTEDGLKGEEGCFGICSFWLSENFALMGRLDEAVSLFESIVSHASPTGLLSEEIDPLTGELLGNYPQGFTHIGLINAALAINAAYEKGGR